jgi:S-adenosylmethionine:tRNA-ribosyltransferase-isomerase (queuine synthetase)
MARLFTGSIDVTKIIKERLFEGKKGKYLNVSVWMNDEEDEYGNIASIQQSTKKDEPKIFIGNLKEFKRTTEESKDVEHKHSDPAELDDDLPF